MISKERILKNDAMTLDAMRFVQKAKRQFSNFRYEAKEAGIESIVCSVLETENKKEEIIDEIKALQERLEGLDQAKMEMIVKQDALFTSLNQIITVDEFYDIYGRAVKAR